MSFVVWALVCLAAGPAAADPQLGQLVSPGPLARPHAKLEGLGQCQSCHETGRRVTASKCLSCHAPVAQRIRLKRGVHREVTDDCVTCHVEHMGVDAELRPFDTRGFDHAGETGYALAGKHAPLAAKCQSCHKARSFLTLKPDCASCHEDSHKGTLGTACGTCHSVSKAFKDATSGFDHTRTDFPLTGAHRTVACATCHPNQRYKGIAFQTCASCHKDPHEPRFAGTCASCHVTTESWRTTKVDHARTAFPLKGKHQAVACQACHVQPAMKVAPRADRCSTCHTDVHKGTFAPKDCNACHNENGFGNAPFDHGTTAFALTGAHAKAACESCHLRAAVGGRVKPAQRSVEFRGLKRECLACHEDPHASELGAACEACHQNTTFKLTAYSHRRSADFFAGSHASVGCELCHKPAAGQGAAGSATTSPPAIRPPATRPAAARPATARPAPSRPATLAAAPLRRAPADAKAWHVRYAATPAGCVSCHADVHLGQVSQTCETCHAVSLATFQLIPTFSHAATKYPLTGKHSTVACGRCHKPETAAFPGGHGTTVRLTGLSQKCASCHADVHLGQVGAGCETCHATTGFAVAKYTHRTASHRAFFSGRHATATCVSCHPSATRRFPGGQGTAIDFSVTATCVNCHRDVHNGSLGPDCEDCHKPEDEDDEEDNLLVRALPAHWQPSRTWREEGAP